MLSLLLHIDGVQASVLISFLIHFAALLNKNLIFFFNLSLGWREMLNKQK